MIKGEVIPSKLIHFLFHEYFLMPLDETIVKVNASVKTRNVFK